MNTLSETVAHPDTRALVESWATLTGSQAPGARPAGLPRRVDRFVERLFLLETLEPGVWSFRTAGTELNALIGRDVRGHELAGLFRHLDRPLLRALVEATLAGGAPGLVRARGETVERVRLDLEIVLAPLVSGAGGGRMLGLFQPLGAEPLLRGRPLVALSVLAAYPPADPPRPALLLVASRD